VQRDDAQSGNRQHGRDENRRRHGALGLDLEMRSERGTVGSFLVVPDAACLVSFLLPSLVASTTARIRVSTVLRAGRRMMRNRANVSSAATVGSGRQRQRQFPSVPFPLKHQHLAAVAVACAAAEGV
jgi:hypothetical protein